MLETPHFNLEVPGTPDNKEEKPAGGYHVSEHNAVAFCGPQYERPATLVQASRDVIAAIILSIYHSFYLFTVPSLPPFLIKLY